MFFLNLTAAEFLTLLGALGGIIAALYLLDRAKRRKIVSTLRFWGPAGAAEERQARKRVSDPWSLILQLASLLLLLLAISRMEWGRRASGGRDHVLLLDTGSWSGAKAAGTSGVTVLEREKEQARRYLASIPGGDRVMLVAVNGVATPLTRFTKERRQIAAAIDVATTSFSALRVTGALAFARQACRWSAGELCDVVYTGPMLAQDEQSIVDAPDRLLPTAANRENVGIQEFAAQQVEEEVNSWRAFVRLKNYGTHAREVRLQMQYASTAFAPRLLNVLPGQEATAEYLFTATGAATLTASLTGDDSLPSDDHATLLLPQINLVRVAIYTNRPEALKPLLTANRRLKPMFLPPGQNQPHPPADVIVIDDVALAPAPALPAVWINPPKEHSPLPVEKTVKDALLIWNTRGSLTTALHAKQLTVAAANTFETFDDDDVIATVSQEAVVVLRAANHGRPPSAVVGFDPVAGPLRFEVATPLLFASLLEELAPGAFRAHSYAAEQVGLAHIVLDHDEVRSGVHVTESSGRAIPSIQRGKELQFFLDHPATVHVSSHDRQRVIAFQLPEIAEQNWQIPGSVRVGVPAMTRVQAGAVDLWKWLALAGAGCLMAEWFLFAPWRNRARRQSARTSHPSGELGEERELAAK